MNKRKISVIVPTYNGAVKIGRLIESLKIQSFQDFEVIIVIDGSTDHTQERINELKVDFPITVVVQKKSGRSSSRNNGAKTAKGELICFFDDDMVLPENCLSMHYFFHQTCPNALIIGPTIENPATKYTDFQKYKCFTSEVSLNTMKEVKGPLTKENLFLTAANLSLKKDVFWDIGGFDERLPDAEDYEFGFRALIKEKKLYFKAEAFAFHEEFITCGSFIKRQREYFNGQKILNEINPLANKYSSYKKENMLEYVVYFIVSNKFIVALIDHFNIFKIIPLPLRYRFYSAVVWGLAIKFPCRTI